MSVRSHARTRTVAVARVLASTAGLVLLAAATSAQQREPRAEQDRPAQDEPLQNDAPGHAFELALGGDGLAAAYRSAFHRGGGYSVLGFFVNEDDDLALHARFLRFGEPGAEAPLALGIGVGVFAAAVDEQNAELVAITLSGAVEYEFELAYPVRLVLEASYAPDMATFLDGQRVLDVVGRVETDLSSWATAFAGYRHLEADLENAADPELDSALQIGVRLGV
ncbi:MAG: hypothetical protein HOP15_18325 [Planctomycetes bacterium]|nr:hypothetical protein [Planctomycetota bacterium]